MIGRALGEANEAAAAAAAEECNQQHGRQEFLSHFSVLFWAINCGAILAASLFVN
jgi:hypothetical protein